METQSLMKSGKTLLNSTRLFVIAGTVLMALVIAVMCIGLTVRYEVNTETADTESVAYWKESMPPEQEMWFDKAADELRLSTKIKKRQTKVRNVILYVVEGVNSGMLARSRFRDGQNSTDFAWDKFPYVGALRSSCGLLSPCDPFTLGTALFGGVRTRTGLGGLDERVLAQNCLQASNASYQISSIFEDAQMAKLRTGFVTTQRLSGPLMSALYAHSPDSKWECDVTSSTTSGCQDIATQLLIGRTGQSLNVIMGGGKRTLVSRLVNESNIDIPACSSKENRNLLVNWRNLKLSSKAKFELMENSQDLENLKGETKDYVLGAFATSDIGPEGPSLQLMMRKSLEVLARNKTGYVAVAQTSIKDRSFEGSQRQLLELNDAIKDIFLQTGFTAKDTLLLVAFMDLAHSQAANTFLDDILIYATGPNSHLFHKVHQDIYLAHAISYSLKIGIFNPKKRKS